MTSSVIIVGASVGGVEAAASLRAAGFDGRITLAGAEPHLPYDKPPLSKGLLTGRVQAREIGLRGEDWYEANDVRLLLDCAATGLDAASRRVLLANGHQVPADIVVLATGAAPVLPGAMRGPGVHILRTLDDGIALATALAGAESTVVIGAGFIGAEVAASARASGREVTLVDADSLPFARTVGAEVARAMLSLHTKAGIRTRYGTPVRAATAHQVELADGEILRADVVVAGLGVQPVTGWLADSSVALGNGIRCDVAGQTSVPGVYAVGDAASWLDAKSGQHVRHEHWTRAREQAMTVARRITGAGVAASLPPPYFWSDQHGTRIQALGATAGADCLLTVHGEIGSDSFAVLYGHSGRLVGGIGVNAAAVLMRFRGAIESGEPFTRAALLAQVN